MHEWALAESVVEAAVSALAGRDPAALRRVTVLVGELQAVDREIFSFALRTLASGRRLDPGAFVVETETALLRCVACGRVWGLAEAGALDPEVREAIHFLPEAAHAFLRCPSCGSPDYGVAKGRGVSIGSIAFEEGGEGR